MKVFDIHVRSKIKLDSYKMDSYNIRYGRPTETVHNTYIADVQK